MRRKHVHIKNVVAAAHDLDTYEKLLQSYDSPKGKAMQESVTLASLNVLRSTGIGGCVVDVDQGRTVLQEHVGVLKLHDVPSRLFDLAEVDGIILVGNKPEMLEREQQTTDRMMRELYRSMAR